MPKITIDGFDYHSEDLSDQGQAQLASLQFLEAQLKKLEQEVAVYQTAHTSYAKALKAEIDKIGLHPIAPRHDSE